MGITETIKDYCDKYFSTKSNNYFSTPSVITFYLGEEAYHYASASINDAFASSFTMPIDNYEGVISGDKASVSDIGRVMMDCVTKAANQSQFMGEMKIAFITVMDDPFFQQENDEIFEAIKAATQNMEDYGIMVNYSLYGIFRQDHMKQNEEYLDYSGAFRFVNKGKKIWKNIYHVEVSVFNHMEEILGQLIAMNRISETGVIRQDESKGEYVWRSVALHNLQLPEYVICSILSDIYKRQIGGTYTVQEDSQVKIKKAVEASLDQLFKRKELNAHRFIPLEFVQPQVEEKKKFAFFGRSTGPILNFSKIMKDEGSMHQIAEENYKNIELKDELFHDVIASILGSLATVDADYLAISQLLSQSLDIYKKECQQYLESMPKDIESYDMRKDINTYLDETYQRIKARLILKKKIDIISQLQERMMGDDYLRNILESIKAKNNNYIAVLQRLIGKYGGSIQPMEFKEFTAERLNQPVDELLESLDIQEIRALINNPEMIYSRLDQFLAYYFGPSRMLERSHNLGQINQEYSNLQPIMSRILMTPAQYTDQEIHQIVENKYHLTKVQNPLYRPYSFYVVSTRAYTSDRYIYRYRRGN